MPDAEDLADAWDVVRVTVDDWLKKHTATQRKDVPANLASNVLRALRDNGFEVYRG